MNGWLVLDKHLDISSANALNKIKRLLGIKKMGHAGTLDPFASGVLVVGIGEATKAIDFAMGSSKSYEFTITWGESRDTMDAEGAVTAKSDVKPSKEQILSVLDKFTPSYMQMPPKYSALKVDGKRAYDLARSNVEFELKARRVELSRLELVGATQDTASFSIDCGKGFYVRSLATDIASALGACGYVSTLRRTRVGAFSEGCAISLDNLENMVHNDQARVWNDLIKPITAVLDDILVQQVSEEEAKRLRHGQRVKKDLANPFGEKFIVAMGDEPVAICSYEGGVLKPERIFNINS